MKTGEREALPQKVEEVLFARIEKNEIELPLLPRSTAQILGASDEELGGLLASILSRDASLAASVLQMANTPMYRGTSPIVSISQAMNRIGTKNIRSLILMMSWNSKGFRVGEYGEEIKRLFAHSLGAALCCQEIARRLRKNVEEAFLVGLLHDIGKPILLQAICSIAQDLGLSPTKKAIWGMLERRHSEIGAQLVQRWILPTRFQQIIATHHAPIPPEEITFGVRLLQLGDAFSKYMLEDLPEEKIREHEAIVELNLYPDMLESIFQKKDSIKESVQQFVSTCV